jgi:hypothetical protein
VDKVNEMSAGPDATILPISNRSNDDLLLILEPWGEEHRISPGDSVEISAIGPPPADVRLAYEVGRITAWGWEGSVLSVRRNGVDVDSGRGPKPAVPKLPSGATLLQFGDSVRFWPERPPRHVP